MQKITSVSTKVANELIKKTLLSLIFSPGICIPYVEEGAPCNEQASPNSIEVRIDFYPSSEFDQKYSGSLWPSINLHKESRQCWLSKFSYFLYLATLSPCPLKLDVLLFHPWHLKQNIKT